MSNHKEIFSTSLLLYSTVKGFGLQKLKRNNISSTFKFKAKAHHPKQPDEEQPSDIKQQQITEQLHRGAKQKINQVKQLKKVKLSQIVSAEKQQHKSANCIKQSVRNRINSTTLQPTFPAIDKKKIGRVTTKSFRKVSQSCTSGEPIDIQIKDSLQTIPNKNSNINKTQQQIENLIKKQVLKTENQLFLGIGQLKFDEKQVFHVLKNQKKTFPSKTIQRRKQCFFDEDDHTYEYKSIINKFNLNGPEVKNFNPIRTRYVQTTNAKSKKYYKRYSPDKLSNKKQKRREYSYKQPHIEVDAWEKESLSDDGSQNFQTKHQLRLGWPHRSQRLN